MPSLSKAQIASIFGGQASRLERFRPDRHPAVTPPSTSPAAWSLPGTQTGSRVFFLNDPCAAGVQTFVNGDNGESATRPTPVTALRLPARVRGQRFRQRRDLL